MIGSGVSTDSMMAASFGIIDSIISTTLITSTTSSLSATSAFHGGGVGAGVLGRVGVGATRTDTTAPTTVPVMDTATAVGLEWLNYRAGWLGRLLPWRYRRNHGTWGSESNSGLRARPWIC